MLIVAGTFRFDPDKLDAVVALQGPLMEEVRAEVGCQAYVFSNDTQKPGVQHLFEIWDDEAALAAHARAPHMSTYREAMQQLGALISREVVRYDVGDAQPL